MLAGEILPGCCIYPPDDATLDALDDIDILNRYDMWSDIPPRPVYSYPKIKIRRYADRAVLPESRAKNESSSSDSESPLSTYSMKKKRDWTLTHSDEDIRRYRELCSRTVNRCPLQEMPAYPPTYPAADPHIFARRRRAGRHPLSARDFPALTHAAHPAGSSKDTNVAAHPADRRATRRSSYLRGIPADFPEADDCLYLPVRDAMTHTLLPPWSDSSHIISDTFAAEPSALPDLSDSSDPDEQLLEQQTSALQILVSQVFAFAPSTPQTAVSQPSDSSDLSDPPPP